MDVPVVYITAHTDELTVEQAKATGPSDFLKKPLEDAVLKEAVRKAVGS